VTGAVPPAASRILLVEDEPRIVDFLAKGLQRDGHEVVAAEDGGVGRFMATTEHFDLVILDLGLPGQSGLDVLVAIRAERPDVPVLMLTGHDEPEARRRCLEAGATGFATKPLVFAEFRERVAAILRGEKTAD
jgi:two-component system, OmpR family, copper resistance phosphate regulon response regulator CusR